MKDNSRQGYVDEDIKPLLEKINRHKGLKTTSSCSGRIVILKGRGSKKRKAEWLFKSHQKADKEEAWESFQKTSGNVWLLQEPLIIHVKCSSLADCQKLLAICNKAGLRHSGMFSTKNFMVEIRGSERIEAILNNKLVGKKYFFLLIKEANKSLEKAKEKIKKLMKEF